MQEDIGKHKHRHRVKVRVRRKRPSRKKSIIKPVALLLGVAAIIALLVFGLSQPDSDSLVTREGSRFNEQLADLPPNKWVKLHIPFVGSWHRQEHASMAFDTHRNKLFVFGSDTHGANWDNSVHEFDPLILRWSDHYRQAPRRDYTVDSQGHPVADRDQLQPWAMHAYANVVYDPKLDALFVMSMPEHNPAQKVVRGIKRNPAWIYELSTRRWRMLDDPEEPMPFGPGGASAYDSDRDVIMTYGKQGIWELSPDRSHWLHATSESHHEKGQSMVYDSRHHKMLIFGGQRNSNTVWVYTPGTEPGKPGIWQEMTPGGDKCPSDPYFPVAYDSDFGVFLLVLDNPPSEKEKVSESSSTCVYDLESNSYLRLPEATLPSIGMNYMMSYDPSNKVFFLVTGDKQTPPSVWALHLELFPFEDRLKPSA